MENPPIGLFAKGNLKLIDPSPSLRMTNIGVVGTRKITQYGKDVTELIVRKLVQNNVCIVSGLALGVDGLAHRVTLQNNGAAIAVLACGVDCCTPAENYSLYKDILKQDGLIISEYPLGQPPNQGTFLARNRIIAALSDGVLITQAAQDSGSLVTADWGLRLEKKVFAVPGSINSQMSKGSLKLLKQGAHLVTEANDVLQEFKTKNLKLKTAKHKFKNLTIEERKIISLLESEDMTVDELAKKLKIPVSKLFTSISNLEIKEVIKNSGGKILLN
jgi:DNA processing protein